MIIDGPESQARVFSKRVQEVSVLRAYRKDNPTLVLRTVPECLWCLR